jgi:hypothetical protein
VRSAGPTDRSAGLLVGRTHLSGTAVSLVGGDPGVPMSHTHQVGGSMTITGEPLRPQGFRRTLYNLIQSRITSQGWHNLALTHL